MLLKALVDVLDVEHKQISSDVEFHSIITDSRRAVKGGLFFAISGFKQDGNSFIEEAIERGVVAVISEEPVGKFFRLILFRCIMCDRPWRRCRNYSMVHQMKVLI